MSSPTPNHKPLYLRKSELAVMNAAPPHAGLLFMMKTGDALYSYTAQSHESIIRIDGELVRPARPLRRHPF